ncbi:MAG TPA: type II toxin-antitoxin system VapC family toxin [Nocardioides sp.]|nr:type II toxin-antitoxin system VapC family toxin [Nocardioides sp.]
MRPLLLDSHVALWLLDDSPRLGDRARDLIARSGAVFVSAASLWELRLKSSLGRLVLPDGFVDGLREAGLRDLAISSAHAMAFDLDALPHRDPFDAMLVTQARHDRLALMTADAVILDAWSDAIDARL